MNYNKLKVALPFFLGFFSMAVWQSSLFATTTISSGHADIFEAEYLTTDESTGLALSKPEIHLGVHTDTGHFEPGDVLLEVGSAAYTSTASFPSAIYSILGANAWILPADLEQAGDLGLIEAGVAKDGFPTSSPVTFTMLSAGTFNPGNFVLFSSSNSIRLSTIADTVGANSFSITSGHIHYNWGFSAAGTYTFDMQASYTDPGAGVIQSATETYTFLVIPEPSMGGLLLAATAVLTTLCRKRRN